MNLIEIRCPVGPRRLLFKMRLSGEQPHVSDNLIELSCDDCKRTERKKNPTVIRVLHRFDLAGNLIESEVEHAPEADSRR